MITKTCPICNNQFSVSNSRAKAKFCSRDCYLVYHSNRVTKKCGICGKEFEVSGYRSKTARFCSFECGGKWHMSIREMSNEHKIGNKWRKGLRPSNAFTSEQAIAINTIQGNVYKCYYCGKEFEIKPWLERQNISKSGRRFCSKKCHGNYCSEYLSGENSPHWVGGITTYRGKGWKESREVAVKRDNGTCQKCGRFISKSIPVHHINPFRNYNTAHDANSLDNLVCLCQSCHMKVEHSI